MQCSCHNALSQPARRVTGLTGLSFGVAQQSGDCTVGECCIFYEH